MDLCYRDEFGQSDRSHEAESRAIGTTLGRLWLPTAMPRRDRTPEHNE